MSWIKLDDQIAHHPKFTRISPAACWLYVCGIGFCQKFLTDGHIPFDSVSKLSHVRFPLKSAMELVQSQLWVRGESGYTVHDYLKFNDTAESVKIRRENDRIRKLSARNPSGQHVMSGRNPSEASRARASHPIPSIEDPKKNKLVSNSCDPPKNGNGNGGGASKRPIYQSDRFVVFEWQLDSLSRMLGDHADGFDLHAWFDTLTQRSRQTGLVIPKRCDEWLQAQTLAEAQRRGFQIATGVPVLGKQSTRIMNMLAKFKTEDARDDTRKLR